MNKGTNNRITFSELIYMDNNFPSLLDTKPKEVFESPVTVKQEPTDKEKLPEVT